ncbi:MAG: hypothetical protein JWL85_440 [Candidatus Saccharibacteria bacterium]|nr:hypothetical protein [Candidatus Saccharibacteria bacterium]
MIRLKALRQRGDTIVEVLIAIAVISLILGGAYASSRKSLQTTRSSQERGEVTKYVEQQVELLKSAVKNPSSNVFTMPGSFCLDSNLIAQGASNAICRKSGPGSGYALSITRNASTFTVTGTWDKIDGSGSNQVQIVYRTYQ